jgi:hypothetical protein
MYSLFVYVYGPLRAFAAAAKNKKSTAAAIFRNLNEKQLIYAPRDECVAAVYWSGTALFCLFNGKDVLYFT